MRTDIYIMFTKEGAHQDALPNSTVDMTVCPSSKLQTYVLFDPERRKYVFSKTSLCEWN